LIWSNFIIKMKYLLVISFLLSSLYSFGQEEKLKASFINEFKNAIDKPLSERELNEVFKKYDRILTPHSDITQLVTRLEGEKLSVYPLADFKGQKLYHDNIDRLVNSKNSNKRILAYLVIAASGDTTKNAFLLEKIKTETSAGNLLWSGMALLYLRCDHTTPLFDFLVKNEDFGDAHMLPLYIKLNKDSLQQTAYNRINSKNVKAKILASQILSVTPLTKHAEELLKQAVKGWSINIKGYAIYSIKELQIGNLLDLFKPLLDSSKTRYISLQALANSPTEADRNYVYELVDMQRDTIPKDLLDCLYKSKNEQNIQYWLKLLYTKPISTGYIFFVFDQPLLRTNTSLSLLQNTLTNVKSPEIQAELVRALEGRTDDISVDIMIRFLNSKNSTVRYWTASTLKNNLSPKVKTLEVQALINKSLKE